ncbi:MAG: discoidin domain-containing protein [Gemmatimonadales bacterium]
MAPPALRSTRGIARWFLLVPLLGMTATASGQGEPIVARIIADRPIAHVDPARDWGAALDGHDFSDIAAIYTPANIAAMRSAGLGPISYRLRTELGIEAWHWNPDGTWSDPAHQQGYWTSSSRSDNPITVSFGYRLPRRGRTIDDANNDGYSRIDDGDTTTFWKTNPYLDPAYTGDPASFHPQWFSIDLGEAVPVDEIRLLWGAPYAVRYEVDYWRGDSRQLIDDNPSGEWRRFPGGDVVAGRGGTTVLRLARDPVRTRFVRVVMYAGSRTAAGGNGDRRDSLGFALREVYIGDIDKTGALRDRVRHDTVAVRQSVVLASSTDPWHRAIDRDSGTTQPGFDLVMRSSLTNRLPVLVPTGLLFDTPDNAAAEVRFLESRHYPLQGIELGEEPDGERVTPEDYGALYLQFARAIHGVDPRARLGGPSWQNLLDDPLTLWPRRIAPGHRDTWIGRFLDYLDQHGRRDDYRFFSFEWYPFDNVCDDPAANLAAAPGMLADGLAALRHAGLPDSIPRIMTEYGYSAHLSPIEVQLPSALFDADVVANFFAHGGSKAFYFGYEPGTLSEVAECHGWGDLLMLLADSTGLARDRLPRYYAAWLLTHAWADSSGGRHAMYPVRLGAGAGDSLVTAFALRRPDRRWALLLVNREPVRQQTLRVELDAHPLPRSLRGPVDVWQYSPAEYHFAPRHLASRPDRDLPPSHRVMAGSNIVVLPPYSITVVSGW